MIRGVYCGSSLATHVISSEIELRTEATVN